jgi:hypothetical protein
LNRPSHPLIGKLLWLSVDDPELYTVSRFEADLGHGLLLCSRLNPRTGEKLDASHVVSDAAIFENWRALMRAVDGPEDGNRVRELKPELVRRNGQRSDSGDE